MIRGKRRRQFFSGGRRWVIPSALLLLILLGLFFLVLGGEGDSPLDFTIKGFLKEMMEDHKLKSEEQKLLKKIHELEERKDEAVTHGILDVGFKASTPSRARLEAFKSLGRIGNQEDVRNLVDRSEWYQRPDALYMEQVAETLAEIGGDEACRALGYKLFEGAGSARYSTLSGYALNSVVSGIGHGNCLGREEVQRQLWNYGRDMWAGRWIHEASLEILAKEGDEEATGYLKKYQEVLDQYREKGYENYSLDDFSKSLTDDSLPWYLKSQIANGLRYKGSASKETVLDLYMRVMEDWYSSDASARFTTRDKWFVALGRGIFNSRSSSWQGQPRTYFNDRAEKYKVSPDLFTRDRMLHLIETLRNG